MSIEEFEDELTYQKQVQIPEFPMKKEIFLLKFKILSLPF